jgi:hypothetical protein
LMELRLNGGRARRRGSKTQPQRTERFTEQKHRGFVKK